MGLDVAAFVRGEGKEGMAHRDAQLVLGAGEGVDEDFDAAEGVVAGGFEEVEDAQHVQ